MPLKRQRNIVVDKIRVGNYQLPLSDGTSTYVIATDGSGGLYWSEGGNANLQPWTKKTSNYTAISGDRIIADSSTGTFTVFLPASPTIGNSIQIIDGAAFAATATFISANGNTIEGDPTDVELDITGVIADLIYNGTTWLLRI